MADFTVYYHEIKLYIVGMNINLESLKDRATEALTIHKMIEAIKFAYGNSCLLGFDESDKVI